MSTCAHSAQFPFSIQSGVLAQGMVPPTVFFLPTLINLIKMISCKHTQRPISQVTIEISLHRWAAKSPPKETLTGMTPKTKPRGLREHVSKGTIVRHFQVGQCRALCLLSKTQDSQSMEGGETWCRSLGPNLRGWLSNAS